MTPRKHGRVSGAWCRPARRFGIYARDCATCVWCGECLALDDCTLDHVFPRWSAFRDNDSRRVVTACRACNCRRRHLAVARWLRKLKHEGRDLDAIYRRLQVARYVPVNRRAGARLLAAWRAQQDAPRAPPDPEDLLF